MNKKVKFLKRAMDMMASSVGLMALAPVMAAVAAAVKLQDGGAILFVQRRAGSMEDVSADAKIPVFHMLKFRTMREDAEDGLDYPVRTVVDDPRVTKVGRFLRRTHLDELPQLINVLKGDMSLVGPRPERPEVIQDLSAAIPFFEERMRLVKPGITGLAQVLLDYMGQMDESNRLAHMKQLLVNPFGLDYQGTNEADDLRIKLLFDFSYAASLERVSAFLVTDLEVILRTLPNIVFCKGR